MICFEEKNSKAGVLFLCRFSKVGFFGAVHGKV